MKLIEVDLKTCLKAMVIDKVRLAQGLMPAGWTADEFIENLWYEFCFIPHFSEHELNEFKDCLKKNQDKVFEIYLNFFKGEMPGPKEVEFLNRLSLEERLCSLALDDSVAAIIFEHFPEGVHKADGANRFLRGQR